MTPSTPASRNAPPSLPRLLPLLALLLAVPLAHAQYKVIGADGKVTYTDRTPNATEGRVSALGARGQAEAAAEAELPFELRQVTSKYPVTLYTATGACDPCVAARQLLKQRGVPYSERQAMSSEDVDALEKITGGRDAPSVVIGTQVVRGLNVDTWNQYLDAAGYPRESRLPSTYQYRAAAPIVERREPAPQRADAAPAAAARPSPSPFATTAPPAASGIRF